MCVLVKVSSKGRREGERRGNEATRCGRVSNVNNVFVRLEPQDDLIHRTKKSGQNLLSAVNLWILLSLLNHPGWRILFPSGLTTIDRIIVRLFRKFKSMEPPFGRILIMELPSGNILRASSKMMPTSCKRRAVEKTSTWRLSINQKKWRLSIKLSYVSSNRKAQCLRDYSLRQSERHEKEKEVLKNGSSDYRGTKALYCWTSA